jgi:hypothetical protein
MGGKVGGGVESGKGEVRFRSESFSGGNFRAPLVAGRHFPPWQFAEIAALNAPSMIT